MSEIVQNTSINGAGVVNTAFNIVTTNIVRSKLAKALAETGRIPVIKYLAFGDGGVDINNVPIPPDTTMTGLKHERFRLPVTEVVYPVPTTADMTVLVDSAAYNGIEISEFGAVDEDGDFVGIQSMQIITKQENTILKFHWKCEF